MQNAFVHALIIGCNPAHLKAHRIFRCTVNDFFIDSQSYKFRKFYAHIDGLTNIFITRNIHAIYVHMIRVYHKFRENAVHIEKSLIFAQNDKEKNNECVIKLVKNR